MFRLREDGLVEKVLPIQGERVGRKNLVDRFISMDGQLYHDKHCIVDEAIPPVGSEVKLFSRREYRGFYRKIQYGHKEEQIGNTTFEVEVITKEYVLFGRKIGKKEHIKRSEIRAGHIRVEEVVS